MAKRGVTSVLGACLVLFLAEAAGAAPAYQGTWAKVQGPPGGIGYDIRYNFESHDTWYVTDQSAGFLISNDRGMNWHQSNTGMKSGGVFSATVDPRNPKVIWAGTRDPGFVYKSTDGGASWVDVSPPLSAANPDGYSFRGFTVHPDDSNKVYAMSEVVGWVLKKEGKFAEYNLDRDVCGGRIFKTTDGGRTWQVIWEGRALARYLFIDPSNHDILYASTGLFDKAPLDRPEDGGSVTAVNCGGIGVIKSEDGGQSWVELGHAAGIENLTVGTLFQHPSQPGRLLAGGGSNLCLLAPDEIGDPQVHGGVYRSVDFGKTWETVLERDVIGAVEVCEKDPSIVFAVSARKVYRSTNGGDSWEARWNPAHESWGPEGVFPGTPIDAQLDPEDCERLAINNYTGGVFLSEDGGQSWMLTSGYSGAGVGDLTVNSANPLQVRAATGMSVWESTNGGTTWVGHANLDLKTGIGALAESPADTNTMVGSMLGVEIYLTHDGGRKWTRTFTVPRSDPGTQIRNFAFAPSDPRVIYATTLSASEWPHIFSWSGEKGRGVYHSTDGGNTWSPATDHTASLGFRGLAVHPTNPKIAYAGSYYDSGIFKTTDGGSAWTAVNSGLVEPYGHFLAMAIDPRNPEVVYAGSNQGLFKSNDGGARWARVNAGLDPIAIVAAVVIDQTNPSVIYAGTTNMGVYYSTDGGTLFQKSETGFGDQYVSRLALSGDGTVLYAAGGGFTGSGVCRLSAGSPSLPDGGARHDGKAGGDSPPTSSGSCACQLPGQAGAASAPLAGVLGWAALASSALLLGIRRRRRPRA